MHIAQRLLHKRSRFCFAQERFFRKQAKTNRVEGSDRHPSKCVLSAESRRKAFPHFRSRLVGEGYGRDFLRLYAARFDQMGNPGHERLCFARTGTGDDRNGRRIRFNSALLLGVEFVHAGRHIGRGLVRLYGLLGLFMQAWSRLLGSGRKRHSGAKQGELPLEFRTFFRRKKRDSSINAIIAAAACHLPGPQTAHAFSDAWACSAFNIRKRRFPQNIEFRPKRV